MVFDDGWTVSSVVSSSKFTSIDDARSIKHEPAQNWARSAQAEHTILITDTGADVLTRSDGT